MSEKRQKNTHPTGLKRLASLLAFVILTATICLFSLDSTLKATTEPVLLGGPTYVSGVIDTDTNWTVADSPYIVTGDLTVGEGVTLIIEPGVEVRFVTTDALSFGEDPDKVELIVAGTLVADGATFTSNADSPAAGDWYGIGFLDSSINYGDSGCIIENSVIEYGTVGISIDGASPLITTNTIQHMKGKDGETGSGMGPSECPDKLDGDWACGIRISAAASPEITDNIIFDIRGGIGGRCGMLFNEYLAGEGGDAIGIQLEGTSSAVLMGNSILEVKGGDQQHNGGRPVSFGSGGNAIGIQVEDTSSSMLIGNSISQVGAGQGAGAARAIGIFLRDTSTARVDENLISEVSGGAGMRGSPGGVGAGIYTTAGSLASVSSNMISNIQGGKGANSALYRAHGGCLEWDAREGGIGAGVYNVEGSSVVLVNNLIFNMEGGSGGDADLWCGLGDSQGKLPGLGGNGGSGVGVHIDNATAQLINNTLVDTAGGEPGVAHATQVEDSSDDAYDFGDSKSFVSDSATMPIGMTDGHAATLGLRFAGVDIPQGNSISSAALVVKSYLGWDQNTKLRISGHDADNSPTFNTASYPSSRSKTSAQVDWDPGPWSGNEWDNGWHIGPIIQEIVDRPGWSPGNAITLIIEDNGSPENSGRQIYAWDNAPGDAAILWLGYPVSRGEPGKGIGVQVTGSSSVTVTNSIIVSHDYGISVTDSVTSSISYNDVWANSDANYSGVAPGTNDISADPLFVDPASNDYHLQCGSPAIDAGTNEGAPLTDFEGDPRPLDGNSDGIAVVDVGADEFRPAIYQVYLPLLWKSR